MRIGVDRSPPNPNEHLRELVGVKDILASHVPDGDGREGVGNLAARQTQSCRREQHHAGCLARTQMSQLVVMGRPQRQHDADQTVCCGRVHSGRRRHGVD
jgi:hypothetical protein